MNDNPKKNFSIDIIMPSYNKANYLDDSIKSIINQSLKNWKLYIIDDNSTDNSLEIIDKYSELKNINIIRLKKNKGPSFCRNLGMRISKSKYISFIDSDDTWDTKKLEKQIRFMEDNNFVFTYTDYTPFFEKEGIKKIKKPTSLVESFNFETFTRNSSINTTTMIISRSILKTHRFKKIKLLEDYVFKCGLLINNKAMKLNENLATYRILNQSRSSKRIKNIYWLWNVNKKFNKLNFLENLLSIFSISLNSIKKYGIK
jgi:teichuronic acid biosynthesis glycosyltransferase TuaG